MLGQNTAGAVAADQQARQPDVTHEILTHCDAIRTQLVRWRNETLVHLPEIEAKREKSERLGVSGASEKRIGVALYRATGQDAGVVTAYNQSMDFYRKAVEADPNNHWAMTQFLSIRAIAPGGGKEAYRRWWLAARALADMQRETTQGRDRAWALGTLAELELLGTTYDGRAFRKAKVRSEIQSLCRELVDCVEAGDFAIGSTERQFRRYVDYWSTGHPDWKDLAQAALDALKAPVA